MASSIRSLRVVLADDHHFFREGLREMLAANGIAVVAETADGDGAVRAAQEHEPDVVVVDLSMAGRSGIDAVRRIASTRPRTHVVALSVSTEQSDALDAFAAGACCHLPKETQGAELVASIRLAADGHAVLSAKLVQSLIARVLADAEAAEAAPMSAASLSNRELEVLRLIARGADNATIGRELSISGHTVKQHVTSIFGKLAVRNRVQAAVCAVRAGLV